MLSSGRLHLLARMLLAAALVVLVHLRDERVALRLGVTSDWQTPTERDASFTYTTGDLYCGAIFTEVCAGDVVAPPISSGTWKSCRSISRATCTISSSDGVIRPDSPMKSAFSRCAVSRMRSHGHHHAEIDDLEVVALEHDADDVLADVVHVALHGGDDDAAVGARDAVLLLLDERHEMRDRALHHARALHHLRQEHLAGAEQVADDVHAVHQRTFDHLQRPLGS